jgi:hypothetical protein
MNAIPNMTHSLRRAERQLFIAAPRPRLEVFTTTMFASGSGASSVVVCCSVVCCWVVVGVASGPGDLELSPPIAA